ncbi:hypothetical protein ACH5RR_039710 [Cinchona calisaya]|uniref:Lon N-terminal domain-containing protein n=1 Tax=Cinchona calisaya TaxID=153742 RepID=A0ABD2Y2F0_9GENT
MDVPTRWNSTFLMLDSALPLKEAFGRLEQIDRNYNLNPSEDEWKVAYIVHDCLKKFYDATNHFSGNSFPTSNVFFPDICKLQLKLKEWENSDHDFIRNMVGPMKEKFEKHWDECCLVLAIAVVFDPRFKLALVKYNYNTIYGENAKKYVDRVRSAIVDLFVEYGGELNPSFGYACGSAVEESTFTGAKKESDDISDDMFSNFDKCYHSPEGASASGEFSYDTSLAALHSYLGDVEDTHNGRAFLDGGIVLNLPIFYLQGVVLFPEATLPLRVIHAFFIAAVHLYRDPSDNRRVRFLNIGTTAEIRQYRRLEDGSVNGVSRGQQRFHLRRRWIDVEGATFGEVQIIQEDSPLKTPREAVGRLAPLMNLRSTLYYPRASCFVGWHGNDSDAMSEESLESELSLHERGLHQSALFSSYHIIHSPQVARMRSLI